MCVCLYVCPMYVQAGEEGRRGFQILELKLQAVVNCLVWVLRTNSDPLENQQVFLITES